LEKDAAATTSSSCSKEIGYEDDTDNNEKTKKKIEELKNNKKSLIKIFKPAHKESLNGNQFYILAHEGLTNRFLL